MNRGIVVVLCALLPALSQPAFTEEPGTNTGAAHVDDEVTVTATRKLTEMRKEIEAAEDRFLAKYNELNKERQYEIRCAQQTPTGTRFHRRVCMPQFINDAAEAEARAWLQGYSAPPASLVVVDKTVGFRKNMVDLARKSPELSKLALERADLEKRYDETLKQVFDGKKPNE